MYPLLSLLFQARSTHIHPAPALCFPGNCVLNAENGYEGSRQITPAASTKNIAIIGAGIAGLEAARVSALRGHHVTIFEKSLQIGGQLLIASVPPRKEVKTNIWNFLWKIS